MTSSLRSTLLLVIGGMLSFYSAACQSGTHQQEASTVPNVNLAADSLWVKLPYDLERFEQNLSLPRSLREVSGLGYLSDGELVMLNDELGVIYFFSVKTKEVTRKISFALPGDFEGVEVVGEKIYALKSDGVVFEVDNLEEEDSGMESFRTLLKESDDTEGLGYDSVTQTLLIACKEPGRVNDHSDRWRAVFSFDLATKKLLPEATLIIDLAEVKTFLQATAKTEKEMKRAVEFEVEKKKSFKPSAIAIHPISGNFYVLASAGQLLLVLNREGRVLAAEHLSRNPFVQPEGICFAPNGDLFVSNEGRDGLGTLLVFPYQP